MNEQHHSHICLWRLWLEYQMRPIEQIKMFHAWVDKVLGGKQNERTTSNTPTASKLD